MTEVFVNMGQISSFKTQGILTTVGLGSCVGVALYDDLAKVGVMGHIFLPQSREKDAGAPPGKYADTGIPAMIDEAIRLGARKSRLKAKLAGGANLFPNLSANSTSIGMKNIKAVTGHLEEHGIAIIGKDVAGGHGRKMRFFVDTGVVTVTAIGKEAMEI
ncbi:MAG: chemotaxis protein CheD [Limnochordia bacterium]|jgi:chemotaxis protein CheD|nr:chemotaxis protein CheD [Limnochordia bacterium]